MTWLQTLAAELTARGVRGRDRRRILLELRDHIECEPGCEDRLGDPAELAATFADELAGERARGAAFGAFAALSTAAAALAVSQLAIRNAGGYPGFANGLSLAFFVPACLGMFVASQVALVTGSLAALRALRLRRTARVPAAEVGLILRRARVALIAGFATLGGLGLYLADFSLRLPGWYLAFIGAATGASAVALSSALATLGRAGRIISSVEGEAGDVFDDVPVPGRRWLRRRPWFVGLLGSLLACGLMSAFQAHAERSLAEGLQRGVVEGLAVSAGFVLLGRLVGLLPGEPDWPRPSAWVLGADHAVPGARLIPGPHDQRAGDEDRARGELVLRESFARGRLELDELTARVSAVHEARTIGELREALLGLPPEV